MSRRICDFRLAEQVGVFGGEVVEGVLVDFGYAGTQVGADEEFPAFNFGLDYNEGEVGFRVHVAGHLLDEFDLLFYAVGCAVDEAVFGPAGGG